MSVMLSVILALAVGLAIGSFLNDAITFRAGAGRNIWLCLAGALIGGVLLPALFSVASVWVALLGAAVGAPLALVLWLWVRSRAP